MASATKISETIETIKSVTLELTLEEARTLAVVYCKVGGSDGTYGDSPRRHVASVFDALEDVGIAYKGAPEYYLIEDIKGKGPQSLYFSNYPAEG